MSRVKIQLIEVTGFPAFLESLRMPYKKEVRSTYSTNSSAQGLVFSNYCHVIFDPKDLALAKRLKENGDEHAKSIRLITVDCIIDAPIWFWNEMVTYEKGVTKGCSESSMHCECRGMSGEELEKFKDNSLQGAKQKRVYKISYQTFRRIYQQRKDHRLPSWQAMIQFIEKLPFAEELILFENK